MAKKPKKSKKKPPGPTAKEDIPLCNFGFPLRPSCSAYQPKIDLRYVPQLRQLITDGTIPPYCYHFVDQDTVLLDNCLVCHMKKGITPQEYERRNEEAGITRANFNYLKEMWPFIKDDVEQGIVEQRRSLVETGFVSDITEKKNIPDA